MAHCSFQLQNLLELSHLKFFSDSFSTIFALHILNRGLKLLELRLKLSSLINKFALLLAHVLLSNYLIGLCCFEQQHECIDLTLEIFCVESLLFFLDFNFLYHLIPSECGTFMALQTQTHPIEVEGFI